MADGNKYAAGVTSLGDKDVRIIIRETYQDPANYGKVSFPTAAKVSDLRPYTKGTLVREEAALEDELEFDDEDDWEIISTLAPWLATAEKVRAAMPGTPIMPRPSTVTRLKPSMAVMALTVAGVLCASLSMRVPRNSGLNVFLTHNGISRSIIGLRVFGCKTLAPK